MSTIALAVNYWLHLLATVIWLGGLAVLVLVVWPGLSTGSDGNGKFKAAFDVFERRFRPFAQISLLVLIVTGVIQMGGDPHYEGALKIGSLWSWSLFLKHIVIAGMIFVSVIIQFSVRPALERARLLAQKGAAKDRLAEVAAQWRYQRFVVINLVLGIIVLLLTALLTAA